MLCGNAISGVSVTLSYVFKELECVSIHPLFSHNLQNADIRGYSENRDKTETYLAFGASRFEACRPLVCRKTGNHVIIKPTYNKILI